MSWYRVPLWDLWPDITSSRNVAVWNLRSYFCEAPSLTRGRVCNLQCNHSMVEVQVTLRLTVSQSVCLGIEYPCGTCDQILLPLGVLVSEICGLISVRRPLWREDRSAICSVITQWSKSKLLHDCQSVSQYVLALWNLRPDITSCRNVAVCNLRSCFCGAPSLTRAPVCNLQCNHSVVRVAQNS
jgi:hypothetical protein